MRYESFSGAEIDMIGDFDMHPIAMWDGYAPGGLGQPFDQEQPETVAMAAAGGMTFRKIIFAGLLVWLASRVVENVVPALRAKKS